MMGEEDAKREVDRIFKSIDVNHTGAIDFTGTPNLTSRVPVSYGQPQEAAIERATQSSLQDV
jgi:hypothetical protein